MKKRKKLSKEDRLEIEILKGRGYGIREIARVLKRSPNTISRELRLNKVKGKYDARKADHKAYVRKKYSRFEWKKINENVELKIFIINCLKKHWNPAEIAGYMKRKNLSFCLSKNSIYRWLYSTQGIPYCRYLYSKRYTKKPRIEKIKRVIIPNRVSIERRSGNIEYRREYGHLEVDTVVSGKRGRGALLVAIDRKSRYVEIKKLSSMKPREMIDTLKDTLCERTVKSITFDNGIENRYHQELNIPTYFCGSILIVAER